MPGLKSEAEIAGLVEYHAYSLNREDKEWFENECQKIQDETGYRLNMRTSGDCAFRLYLLSEKGMSVDDIIDLESKDKDTILGYMRDFIRDLSNPQMTTIEKLEKIGRIHSNAFEKIVDYQIPDPGQIRNMQDLAGVQKKLAVLSYIIIDTVQDTLQIETKKKPEYLDAYSKGAGGYNKLEKLMGRLNAVGNVYNNLKKLISGATPSLVKCGYFDTIKDFFTKFAGKQIKAIPYSAGIEILIREEQIPNLVNEVDVGFLGENEDEFQNYLNGNSAVYPGKNHFEELLAPRIRNGRVESSDNNNNMFQKLINLSMDADVADLLTEEQKKMADLTLLPEQIKNKMRNIYRKSIGGVYFGQRLRLIYSNGKDPFDVIKDSNGRSIRKLAGNKYSRYDSATQEDALILETIRAMAVDKKGLKLQWVNLGPDGTLTLSNPVKLNKVADRIQLIINSDITREDAENYYNNPRQYNNHENACFHEASLDRNFEIVFSNQKDIMQKYNLTVFDCIYVGNKSLKQLYNEKLPGEKLNARMAYAFIIAAINREEPIFAITLSEEKGLLKRSIVPITFKGSHITPEQSKESIIEQTGRAGKEIIDAEAAAHPDDPVNIHCDNFFGRTPVELTSKPLDKRIYNGQLGYDISKQAFNGLSTCFIRDHAPDIYNKLYAGNAELWGTDEEGEPRTIDFYLASRMQENMTEVIGRITGDERPMKLYENVLTPQDNKRILNIAEDLYGKYKKYIDTLPENKGIFRPQMEMTLKLLNGKDFSAIKMVDDNPVTGALRVLNNHGPAVFKTVGEEGYISEDQVCEMLTTMGTLHPSELIFAGTNMIIDAEHKKQIDEKTGWSKEKEQRYFFALKKGYENVIKAYDELIRWPYDEQVSRGKGFEDEMKSLTSVDIERGIAVPIFTMKWEIQAMKNGWHADNIRVMGIMGTIEGNINRIKMENLLKIKSIKKEIAQMEDGEAKREKENEIRNREEIVRTLKTFEKDKLLKFKKIMFNKKITSPRDILECLNIFDKFVEDNRELDVVKTHNLFTFVYSHKTFAEEANNNAIEEVKALKTKPDVIEKKYKIEEIPEYKDEIITRFVRELRSKEIIPADGAVAAMKEYVRMRYLATKYIPDNPQLFKEKNPEYKWANNIVEKQAEQYATEFIEKLAGGKNNMNNFTISGEELLDLIRYGHHEVHFSEMDREIQYNRTMSGFNLLVNKPLKTPEGRLVAMDTAMQLGLEDLKKASLFMRGSEIYDEIKSELRSLIKVKQNLDSKLKAAFNEKKDCTMSPKDFQKLHTRVSSLCGAMINYMKEKNVQRREEGGDLGKNGEARYRAMRKACRAVYCFAQALERYGNSGPTASDFMHKAKGPEADKGKYGVQIDAVKSYINKQKGFVAEKLIEMHENTDRVIASEEEKRRNHLQNVNEEIDDIVKSAEHTLYLLSVKRAFSGNIAFLSMGEDMAREYSIIMAEYMGAKDNSRMFKNFKEQYLDNPAFKEEFKAEVVKKATAGEMSTEDIMTCRDNALKTALDKAKTNADELINLNKVSEMTGSAINTERQNIVIPVKQEVKPDAHNKAPEPAPVMG